MNQFQLFFDRGQGFGSEAAGSFSFDELNNREVDLPEGVTNVRLLVAEGNCILNISEVKACSKTQDGEPLWYDLAFQTDGFRLGHNLFLLEKDGTEIVGSDFRFRTSKLKLSMEEIELSAESTEKLAHSTKWMQDDNKTLDAKWKYQIEVYDEKVQEVVALEKDKVELNQTIDQLRGERDFWKNAYETMENSSSWKMTAPIRSLNASINDMKKAFPIKEAQKAYRARIHEVGREQAKKELFLQNALASVQYMSSGRKNLDDERLEAAELAKRCNLSFTLGAIVRNQSLEEIRHFVDLVMNQTYEDFELILLDASSKDHKAQSKLLQWIASLDQRINVVPVTTESNPAEVLVEHAVGDFFAWINLSDELHVSALYEMAKALDGKDDAEFVYSDSDFYSNDISDAKEPWYKPDWSPDFLNGQNYIRNLWMARLRDMQSLNVSGLLKSEFHADGELNPYDSAFADELQADGKYGLILRILDQINDQSQVSEYEVSRKILHVPEKLYFEKHETLTGTETEVQAQTALGALRKHLGNSVQIEIIDKKNCLFHVTERADAGREMGKPLVSIMIPNKDHIEELKRAIDSVKRLTTYPNYEIVIVENNSSQKETFDYYQELEQAGIARVLQFKDPFNYASINNFGQKELKGDYVLLLNNDVEIITPNWIEEMMFYAARRDVGAVGAKLYYMDDTIQHAGVIIGLGGVAAHSHKDYARDAAGYMNRLRVAQNLSAVTAACILMRREVYEEIGGMDEGYQVAFNDADFCVRIRHHGYKIVFTPFAELHHDESKSRGIEDTPEKAERFESEVQRFKKEWPGLLAHGDPYYNPNLTTAKEDFDIKEELKG